MARVFSPNGVKKYHLTLYQKLGGIMANPVDNDTVDDAPERVQRRVRCTRIIKHVAKVTEIEANARMPG